MSLLYKLYSNFIVNDHTYAANSYSSTKRRKLDILNNTLEAEGLEEPVRDNSPNTSASYQNTLKDECLEESERDVNHNTAASYQNTLEDECLEELERDVNHRIYLVKSFFR
ncbi:unnamed protein product [Gordionus sp. m RMFG-2023]